MKMRLKTGSRREFVQKFHVEISNFNGAIMPSDVKFLYFSQSYISKLFDGESQSKLESFFKKEFSHNSDITDGTADLQAQMEKSVIREVVEDININDEFYDFSYIHGETIYLQVRKSRENTIPLVSDEESYYEVIKSVLPNDKEIWDEQLLTGLNNFIALLVEKICIANYKRKVDVRFSALMKKKIDDIKKEKSKESKRKLRVKRKSNKSYDFYITKN